MCHVGFVFLVAEEVEAFHGKFGVIPSHLGVRAGLGSGSRLGFWIRVRD